jgi:hypothetical protein
MSQRKYERLVYAFENETNEANPDKLHQGAPPEDMETPTQGPDFVLSPQAYFRGKSQIPGSKFNMGFQFFIKPVYLEQQPHYHEVDEYLIFMGTFPNVFDFDAEIEFCLGEEQEKYVITRPTIIRVPAGMSHCPLNFKRIGKPVFFQAALMQGTFGSIMYGKEMWYDGPNRKCCYDKGKKCNYCYKCVGDKDNPEALGI